MAEVEINKQAKLSDHLALPSEAALNHLSELNGLRLSPHFSLGELTKTSAKGVDNTPSCLFYLINSNAQEGIDLT